jgi:RNA polymerase sigma factor (sigma-70 family)
MAAAETKLILLKDGSKVMTFEEVYEQFKAYIFYRINHWSYKLESDELFQLGLYGLFKAYRTYDSGKGIFFMTYCARIIENEILMYNRRNNKCLNTVSLFEVIPGSDEKIERIHLIADKTNYEEVAINEAGLGLFGEVLNRLRAREKEMLKDYYLNHMKQSQMAKKYGITQSCISRLVKTRLPKKLKRILKLSMEDFMPTGSGVMEYRFRSPILSIKRELSCEERYIKPECKISKLTPEQLQYYKALNYEDGRAYLEKILNGEKGENIKMKDTIATGIPVMTKESLQADIEVGMAVNQIAKKYHKAWLQVRDVLIKYELWDKREVFASGGCPKEKRIDVFAGASGTENVQAEYVHTDEPIPDPVVPKTSQRCIDEYNPEVAKAAAAFQQFKEEAEKVLAPSPQKKLKIIAQTLKGEHFTFNIHDGAVDVISVEGEDTVTPIRLEQRLVRPYIEELSEIAEMIGV